MLKQMVWLMIVFIGLNKSVVFHDEKTLDQYEIINHYVSFNHISSYDDYINFIQLYYMD